MQIADFNLTYDTCIQLLFTSKTLHLINVNGLTIMSNNEKPLSDILNVVRAYKNTHKRHISSSAYKSDSLKPSLLQQNNKEKALGCPMR